MIQPQQMQDTYCQIKGHENMEVKALCLRKDCQLKSPCCMKCLEFHKDCFKHLKYLDEIVQATQPFVILRDWFENTLNFVVKQMTQLEKMASENLPFNSKLAPFKSSIQQITQLKDNLRDHYKPITECQSQPNLTNLNQLGIFIKQSKPVDVQGLEQIKQSINKNLDQFRDMLSNRKEQFIQQIVPVVLSQKDKDLIKEYYKQGMGLFWGHKYQESIEYFDKALKIDKNHKDSLEWKGHLLYHLSKYQEAIDCFDQCIKIDPQYKNSYYWKGISLQRMNNHQDAIKCFDEQIKLTPDHINSYQQKGESLRKLFRLKDEEQCYIEGLKHNPDDKNLKKYLSSVQEEMKKQK